MDRVIEKKKLGEYQVSLVYKTKDEGYVLRVLYTGDWAGGKAVEIWIDTPPRNVEDADVANWFRRNVQSDRDVTALLGEAGFDEYTNQVSHGTPVVRMAAYCYDRR